MSEKNLLLAFCGLVVVASLGAVVWVVVTGQFLNMDGLLLICVCLMSAGIFGGLVGYEERDRLRGLLAGARAGKKEEAPTGKEPGRKGGEVIVTAAQEHSAGTRLYMAVWGGLLGLTVLEVILAYQHLPLGMMLAMLMGLSVVKAALIMAYFMHLRFERLNLVLTVVPALVVVISLFFMFFPDSFRILKLGIG